MFSLRYAVGLASGLGLCRRGETPSPISREAYQLQILPRRTVDAHRCRQWDMLTMASSVATVHSSQSLIEVQLVEVRMHLRTIPFTEALHRPVALLMHLLLAERATLVKEPCEEMPRHVRTLPR